MASTKYHVRSVSFPSKSHPSIARAEETLNKLRAATWQSVSSCSSSESLTEGFSMLDELYGRVDDLLNTGSTQQAFSRNRARGGHVEALLESSVRLLDTCGATRDVLLETSERVREVESVMRRRGKGDPGVETCVSSYVCFRKKSKREVKRLISKLVKQEDETMITFESDGDEHFVAAVGILKQVSAVTVSVLRTLLTFVAVSESNSKSKSRWSLVSKFMHKGVVACEDQILRCVANEFESVDSELVVGHKSNVDCCRKSLAALETGVDRLESGLEILFRRLIKTRASLLNIISH